MKDRDETNDSGPNDTDGFITDANNADSDNDGVRDDADAAPNDGSKDTNGDGLTNENEFNTIGSDPLLKDTSP